MKEQTNPTPAALTFLMMDAPYEQARTATAFRILDAALHQGFAVRVFAYEGAVCLPSPRQKPHANAIHGRNLEEEAHPTPHVWVSALVRQAEELGLPFEWVNCGLCVDERGADEAVAGVRRGSPADFWKMAGDCANTLVIATR